MESGYSSALLWKILFVERWKNCPVCMSEKEGERLLAIFGEILKWLAGSPLALLKTLGERRCERKTKYNCL